MLPIWEAFSFNYDPPNDTAYAETCASIGLVFFARRMLEIKASSKYADVMEKALYNGIFKRHGSGREKLFLCESAGILPEACHKDERKFHVKPVRQKWFGCACCPPNIARLLSSIASYAYTEAEDALYVHLYMGSVLEKTEQKAGYPYFIRFPLGREKVMAEINAEEPVACRLAFRIPGWCSSYTLNGQKGLEEGETVTADGETRQVRMATSLSTECGMAEKSWSLTSPWKCV